MKRLALAAIPLFCVLMSGCGNAAESSVAEWSEPFVSSEQPTHFSSEATISSSYGESGKNFSNAPEPVSTSFFSDKENRLAYDELYKSYRYSELKECVQAYIDNNEITDDDVAYTILEYIEPVIAFESEWAIVYDEFDNTYLLIFNGADKLSSSNSVKVSLSKTHLDIKIGFRKNGWLFFDKVALSIDGEKAYTASIKNRTDNIISGNTIEEYCSCSFYDNILESIGKAETVILRFSNKKSGENYDHTLSQTEKNALYCGYLLRVNNRDLSDLLYHYRRDNNIND